MFFINLRRNYAPLDFDRAKNFEQSFTYELPFGRGHAHFNSGVGDAVLGGWKVTGVISLLSGLPFYRQCQSRHAQYAGNCANRQASTAASKCCTTSVPASSGSTPLHSRNPPAAPAPDALPNSGSWQYRQKPVPWPRLHPGQLLHREEVHHLS